MILSGLIDKREDPITELTKVGFQCEPMQTWYVHTTTLGKKYKDDLPDIKVPQAEYDDRIVEMPGQKQGQVPMITMKRWNVRFWSASQ